ncbi:hypothetical protein KKD37_03405 [Patescibacteria group bacterium]|nr:hypothetical protein [Patescibacteria group bacterium]
MVYYLKIAGIGVKVNCPNNLYLFDEWKIFFEEEWGKPFLVKKAKVSITIFLEGVKTKGAKSIKETVPKKSIKLPETKNGKIYFDNLLNPGYLLVLIKEEVGNFILKSEKVIMHASGVVVNNKALLIMGESGSGKTTILKKLMVKYRPIAEDDVVIESKGNKVIASPVLFSIKLDSNLLVSKSYEIGKIITIKKNKKLSLVKISKVEAFQFLLEQSKSLLNTKSNALSIMKFAKLLSDNVYMLDCQKESELNDIIRELNI